MAVRKVKGGKRIDRWSWSIDGRDVTADVYMSKVRSTYDSVGATPIDGDEDLGYGHYRVGSTIFHAVCDEADVHLCSRDISALETAAQKLVTERVAVEWQPVLIVTVTGDRPFVPTRRNVNRHDRVPVLFEDDEQKVSVELQIEIRRLEIAEILGKKYHREITGDKRRPARVRTGLPETGDMTQPDDRHGYYGHVGKTIAMIPDTPDNQAALLAIRGALEKATDALDKVLHPDRIAETLRQVLTTMPSILSLPASTVAQPDAPVPVRERKKSKR